MWWHGRWIAKCCKLAKTHHLTYTRYADDITFSTTKKSLPKELVTWEGTNSISNTVALGPHLERAVERAGFRVNKAKPRVQPPCVRQEVTGLTVNQFPNVERCFVRKVRALIHSWRKNGLLAAEVHHITSHANKPPAVAVEARDGTFFRHVSLRPSRVPQAGSWHQRSNLPQVLRRRRLTRQGPTWLHPDKQRTSSICLTSSSVTPAKIKTQ